LYGLRGSVISAVDLIQGLGICAGLDVVEVPGATGNIHTDFAAKGRAAIAELDRGQDYVYLHVEAPDECGHRAERDNKILAIERIDRDIIGPVWDWLEKHRQETGEPYRLLSLPDHATPLALRTHTREPVPFALYDSERQASPYRAETYDESACARTGLFIGEGHTLFGRVVSDQGL
jgi:2,3-bisphosphoglycerate-independent phosphoglycerate mutase